MTSTTHTPAYGLTIEGSVVRKIIDKLSKAYREHYLLYTGVFVVYTAASIFSSYMYHVVGTSPAVVLAPQGISFAVSLLLGYSIVPVVALGTAVAGIYSGTPLTLTLLAAIANALQPAATLYILDRLGIKRNLKETWDFYVYIAVVLFTSTIVPTINVLGRGLYNANAPQPASSLVWTDLWTAGLVGALILTPFLVRLFLPLRTFTMAEWLENDLAIILLGIPTILLSYTPSPTLLGVNLLIPFCLILLWLALRGGTFFVTSAMVMVSIAAISGRILGHPANPQHLSLSDQIVAAQTSLIIFALLFYFIAALEEGRRAANAKLQAYTQGLEKTVSEKDTDAKAKNEFISMLGHEIRNPLASLLSSVELLKIPNLDKNEQADIVESMEERVRSMSRLLDDILNISRITRKKFFIKKEQVQARAVLRKAVEAADHVIAEKQHRLSVTLPGPNILINADSVRIEQIISNLLHNAAKYTPSGGSIDFSSEFDTRDSMLVIRIKDTGVGLTEEEKGRIFEPFMQVNPNQSLMGGIGLGLTLARNFVEMHDGTIEVVSKGRGHGSEFIVRIPATLGRTRAKARDEYASPALASTSAAQKILVVDDNVRAAETLTKLLQIYSYEVVTVHNGTDALQKAAEIEPHAVLLDIGLPDMNGFEVAKRMRDAGNRSLLVALSGYGQVMHRNEARDSGFDHYLTKPASIKEIIGLMERSADTQPAT